MRGSSRWLSGLAAAAFGLLIVGLGGWWFTLSLGVIVHLALLEFFRLAQFCLLYTSPSPRDRG